MSGCCCKLGLLRIGDTSEVKLWLGTSRIRIPTGKTCTGLRWIYCKRVAILGESTTRFKVSRIRVTDRVTRMVAIIKVQIIRSGSARSNVAGITTSFSSCLRLGSRRILAEVLLWWFSVVVSLSECGRLLFTSVKILLIIKIRLSSWIPETLIAANLIKISLHHSF